MQARQQPLSSIHSGPGHVTHPVHGGAGGTFSGTRAPTLQPLLAFYQGTAGPRPAWGNGVAAPLAIRAHGNGSGSSQVQEPPDEEVRASKKPRNVRADSTCRVCKILSGVDVAWKNHLKDSCRWYKMPRPELDKLLVAKGSSCKALSMNES